MSKKFNLVSSRKTTKIKLLSLGALLFSLGVATSVVATSAWYNLIDIAVVSNLNLKINMSDAILDFGLKKGDDITWIDENHPHGFTKEELGIEDTLLTDISGMYQSDWLNNDTDLSSALPRFHTNYRKSSSFRNPGLLTNEEINKKFVQTEFVLYSANYDMDIYLNESTFVKPNQDLNFEKAKEKAKDKEDYNEINRIKDKLDKVIYASRISFLTDEGYKIINPYKVADTYYGGIIDLDKDGFYDYEDNREILYGEFLGSYVPYSGTGDSDDDYMKDVSKYSTFDAMHKRGVMKVDEVEAKKNIQIEEAEDLKYYTLDLNDPLKNTPICHVKKGEQKRMVMSIYVEGWDIHMTDDIESASFDVSISFTGLVK